MAATIPTLPRLAARPFLGGQGPAPGYCVALPEDRRTALRDLIRQRLPVQPDGSIRLVARAWAVRGRVPPSRGPAGAVRASRPA